MSPKLSPGIPPSHREPTCTVITSLAPSRHLGTALTLPAFSHGANALLLHLTGTLPVNFRGTTYRFPVSIWVPHAYPREPPMVYVVPTEVMMIRPGQHVDPQGLKSNLQDLLGIVTDIFAKEPPVISRQQVPPAQAPQPGPTPPPVPPLPPALAPRPTTQDQSPAEQQRPPPPPPKGPQITSSNRQTPGPAEPPLPPLPSNPLADPYRPSRYDSAPPLPPQANSVEPKGPRFARPTVQNQASHTSVPEYTRSTQPHYFNPAQTQPPPTPQRQWQTPQQHQTWNQTSQPPQIQAKPPPPPDLLDEPLVLNLPTSSTIAAPPIPPNPEKDALLHQLAQTLCAIRMRARQQNDSSMAGLQAQRTAMLSAMPALQAEAGQLTQLSNVLTSNSNILHDALHKADGVIEGSRSHPVPDVDELLVAPTVVANQLYTLVAEERALGDAIFMLGRAVERGRIAPAVFAKMTRSLAREWYLKKALVRKIGQGMALAP
ncbi:UEV domain-containing protein [Dactylonectria estremocensis]|uniref:UEV domain-containing protein n=1 Tax=Dactylonectria estremocensis TaxID=1079267 RepID=A0A9P9DN70_9HYPO|nr:UEV domain-containing protein [Dactylonectria estremocensis]